MMRRLTLCFSLIAMIAPSLAIAGDERGQFAIRGAGVLTCGIYVQARADRDDIYVATAAWLDGYVTGVNQHAANTYDALSFEGAELLMAVVDNHCRANPDDSVFGVASNLISKIWDDRLSTRSDKHVIAFGERETQLYASLVERTQHALADRGFYSGEKDGRYEGSVIDAMKAFQASQGMEPTGFPDQRSLWQLLRDG